MQEANCSEGAFQRYLSIEPVHGNKTGYKTIEKYFLRSRAYRCQNHQYKSIELVKLFRASRAADENSFRKFADTLSRFSGKVVEEANLEVREFSVNLSVLFNSFFKTDFLRGFFRITCPIYHPDGRGLDNLGPGRYAGVFGIPRYDTRLKSVENHGRAHRDPPPAGISQIQAQNAQSNENSQAQFS